MRHIEKDMTNIMARNLLESESYNNDVDNCVSNRKGKFFKSSKYGHDIIRKELNDIYFDKCAYCETKIAPVSTAHIEHYRPKSKITQVNDNGYYWLGYEWSNLLLACPSCNGAKGTKFPLLRNNHVTSHPVDANGDIDSTKFPESNGYLNQERPLLINPEYWKPEKLMYIDYYCKLKPIKNNRLAVTTIKEIQLNRGDLVAKRQKKVDAIIKRIEQQIAARYGEGVPLSEQQYKNQLKLIFQDIIARINPEAEYTFLGKNMIERFDEIILEDIERVFRKEIKNCFIDFLKNI